jgi:recombination DNA repair RAD52 pathway protein
MRLELSEKAKKIITSPIPSQLIKQRQGGGKVMLSYLSGSSVIDILNSAFNYMWTWTAEKEWITESTPYFNQYAKANTVKHNGKDGAWEAQGSVAHVKGTLTVYIEDGNNHISISKTGYGSKSVLGKQNDQESIFKAAGTDALKKAASLFGIGLELYRDEDEQQYFYEMNYEDPWTNEALAEHEEDRNYIKQVMDDYGLSAEDLDPYVEEFSESGLDSMSDIVPDNIKAFTSFLRMKIAASAEASKEETED